MRSHQKYANFLAFDYLVFEHDLSTKDYAQIFFGKKPTDTSSGSGGTSISNPPPGGTSTVDAPKILDAAVNSQLVLL